MSLFERTVVVEVPVIKELLADVFLDLVVGRGLGERGEEEGGDGKRYHRGLRVLYAAGGGERTVRAVCSVPGRLKADGERQAVRRNRKRRRQHTGTNERLWPDRPVNEWLPVA